MTDNGNTTVTGDDFSSNFYYASDNTVDGTRTGFEMSIDQKAGLASTGVASSANDVQTFSLRERVLNYNQHHQLGAIQLVVQL